jgi:hypothetical protein
MAGPVDVEVQAILDGVLQDPAYAGYATLYIGLSTTTPNEDGTGFTEPSGGNYARISTTGADWGAASGTAPATKSNTAAKSYAAANADWSSGANMTHFGLFTALSGGTPKWWGALTAPKPVLNGDAPSFAVGALVLKLGDPGDTY